MNKKWSIQEEQYIIQHAGLLTDFELAIKLTEITGRKITINAIRRKRQKMGLKKKSGRGYCELTELTTQDLLDKFYKET